jgi:hypothetical protein
MHETLHGTHKSKIGVAQDVLIDSLSKLPPTTSVGILTFNGWVYQPGPPKKDDLETAIRSTSAGGGTPLWEFMQVAGTELLKIRQANSNVGNYKILVLTDGLAGDSYLAEDRPGKIGYLTDILRRGIIIDCIGVNMEKDHDLATSINGSYMRANDPESFKKAVAKSVSEAGATSPDVTAECYETMKFLPANFTRDVIHGLSKYENQPIGELASVEVVNKDGSVTVVPPPSPPTSHFIWVVLGIAVGIIFFIGLLFIFSCDW